MRTKREDAALIGGVFFSIDALEGLPDSSPFYGWTAYRVLFACLDARRLIGCEFSEGDVLLRGPPAIESFCIGLRFPDLSQATYAREAIDASSCPALLPHPHRFGTLPASKLLGAGRIDRRGCFVVNADWAYPREQPANTFWKLKFTRSK